jgi:hypothetical protein
MMRRRREWPRRRAAEQADELADDAGFQAPFGAFLQALALLGWTIGRNVRIDTRWATANAAEIRRHAAELVALASRIAVLLNPGNPLAATRENRDEK